MAFSLGWLISSLLTLSPLFGPFNHEISGLETIPIMHLKPGPGYQLRYDDSGKLIERIVRFGALPFSDDLKFPRSVDFQKRAVQAGVHGVLLIQAWKRDPGGNFQYQISGVDTDLYQLAFYDAPSLQGRGVVDIDRQVAGILAQVRDQCKRSHGCLRLGSILLRLDDQQLLAGAQVMLTDFLPDQPERSYENADLKAFARLIIRLASDTRKLGQPDNALNLTDLPDEQDPTARRRFGGDQWPIWREIAKEILAPDDTVRIATLEILHQRTQGNREPPSAPPIKQSQTITFEPLPERIHVGESILIGVKANSGLPVSLSVQSGFAAIADARLTAAKTGRITIKASQAGDQQYLATEAVRHINAVKRAQTIRFNPIDLKFVDDAPVEVTASASSGLPVNLRILSGLAEVQDHTIRIGGTGRVEVCASQAGNHEYEPAADVTQTFEVREREATRLSQTIDFPDLGKKTFEDAPFEIGVQARSGLPVRLCVVSGPAMIADRWLTLTGAGVVQIKAEQAGNDNYLPAEAMQMLKVAKAAQSISFSPLPKAIAVGDSFSLEARASTGLPVTFSVVSGGGTIKGNQATALAAGNLTIQAAQAGTGNYQAVTVSQTLIVNKAAQTIAFDPLPQLAQVGEDVPIGAHATSGLEVRFTLVGGTELEGGRLKFRKAGTVTVKATQPGDQNFHPAVEVAQTITVAKAQQTIEFLDVPEEICFQDKIQIFARASSSLAVKCEILSGPAQLDENLLTATDVGQVKIKATQAGDGDYEPVEAVLILPIVKRPQTIEFGRLPDRKLGDPPFEITAVATSGLPVRFKVSSGPAVITGNQMSVTGVGTVKIAANQPGDHFFQAAAEVVQEFRVKDPKRSRRRLLVALVLGFCLGGVCVAAWWVYQQSRIRHEIAVVEEYIKANNLEKALDYLKQSPILPQGTKNNLEQALRTAPVLVSSNLVCMLNPGNNTNVHLAFDLLPKTLLERENLRSCVEWNVVDAADVADGSGLIVKTLSRKFLVKNGLDLSASAAKNAADGKYHFTLHVTNSLTSTNFTISVLVRKPAVPPPPLVHPTVVVEVIKVDGLP